MKKIDILMPDWLIEKMLDSKNPFPEVTSRMDFAISLAAENVERATGGPFGAAIFDMDSWELVSAGVNLVTTRTCSVLHAEIVAIMIAQRKLGCHDLGMAGKGRYELVTSTEPCAMCFGAIPWSGVASLVCGARGEDAEAIGFDEGPKLSDWKNALEERDINVLKDIMREKAVAVLESYAASGGLIYNGRSRALKL